MRRGFSTRLPHLYSYASNGEHEDDGGRLLRRDLHVLFDREVIAVRPGTLELDLLDHARTFDGYSDLQGRKVLVRVSKKQRDWFAERWDDHRGESASDG
jgi:hypothetical protein